MRQLIILVCIFFTPVITKAQKNFLALGDSYTVGESVDEEMRWPVQLKDKLSELGYQVRDPQIIARTGWRTDELMNAINSAELLPKYDLVGLLIGVNNQYQGKSVSSYEPEFEALLLKAISLAGGDHSRVFVVSIPDYGFTPFGESKKRKISRELDAYNESNKRITITRGVKYFNITDISRSGVEDLVAKDKLHPSGKQYSLWVERILEDSEFFEFLR